MYHIPRATLTPKTHFALAYRSYVCHSHFLLLSLWDCFLAFFAGTSFWHSSLVLYLFAHKTHTITINQWNLWCNILPSRYVKNNTFSLIQFTCYSPLSSHSVGSRESIVNVACSFNECNVLQINGLSFRWFVACICFRNFLFVLLELSDLLDKFSASLYKYLYILDHLWTVFGSLKFHKSFQIS